jgi:response regulator RpfG family c-di-GMP phosphodiesterase
MNDYQIQSDGRRSIMNQDDYTFTVLYNYTKALSVALGHRDLLTRLHSERVHGLAEELAIACNLFIKDLGILKIAASFHDIGKIGIPDHILLKPSKLNDVEWKKMKEHSVIGENIIAATDIEGSQQASLLIRHHHEHFDGNGYPDKLSGEAIPIGSRIISIVDSYDAMAVTRSYHGARSHLDIMAIMNKETGIKHDPNLMQIFCKIIDSSKFKSATA